MSTFNRFKTSVDIRVEFSADNRKEIRADTIRNRLQEKGYKVRSPEKKTIFYNQNETKTVRWARNHASLQQWRTGNLVNLTFLNRMDDKRKSGERLCDQCMKKKVKHPAGKIIWRCFFNCGIE